MQNLSNGVAYPFPQKAEEEKQKPVFISYRKKKQLRVLARKADKTLLLKKGIWLYFLLLLFEGALRKWVIPEFSTPLLVVRDPIALALVLLAWKRGLLPRNKYLSGMVAVGVLGFLLALLLGHGSIPVALYGARILLLHVPLIFVIGSVFDREDVLKLGKVTLWISIPMAVLLAMQFFSPQSAWVNRGLGGDLEGAGFGGAMGYFRAPTTFSFTNGTTLFFSLVACFVLYFWLSPGKKNRLLLLASTVGLLAAIPLSISRGLFFQVGVTMVFALIAISRKPQFLGRMLMAAFGCVLVVALLSETSFFQTAMAAFTNRFNTASDFRDHGLEGVLIDRFLGEMFGPLLLSSELPFFGYGLGMGTNVGSAFLAGGRAFLIDEEEWGRVIGELGPLLGIGLIVLRLGLSTKIAWASYRHLIGGELLPWMLLSFGVLQLAQGGWSQPTSLGFCTLMGGLMIASLRSSGSPAETKQKPVTRTRYGRKKLQK